MNLSPMMMLARLHAAFLYVIGKGKPSQLFTIDKTALWQAVWGGWIIHILATSFATSLVGIAYFAKLSLVSLVSSLGYILLVHFMMSRIEKEKYFLKFIIPYQWLTAFQAVCFGVIALIVMIFPNANAHILVIPVLLWIVFRTWQLIRDEMKITGGLAVGFILARILLDGAINIASGDMLPLS